MAAILGFKDVFDLYYQNHEMDGISSLDIRGRLVLLFRFLKVNTIVSFNPWGHGEENPDHWGNRTSGGGSLLDVRIPTDFEEHREAGFQPQEVLERYYFHGRPGQPFNRVVDIADPSRKKD